MVERYTETAVDQNDEVLPITECYLKKIPI